MSGTNVVHRRHVTAEIKRVLATETSRPVGVVEAPINKDTGDVEELPYIVLFPVKGGRYFGPKFNYPEADASFLYVIHSIGLRDDQAQALADAVTDAMIGRYNDGSHIATMSPPGLTVMDRQMSNESPGPLLNDGKIFYVVDTFLVSVTTS